MKNIKVIVASFFAMLMFSCGGKNVSISSSSDNNVSISSSGLEEIPVSSSSDNNVSMSSSVKETFTIIWRNWDGTILELDENVELGTFPTYDGETPVRNNDSKYSYSFLGWTPEIMPVSNDASYKATYSTEILPTLEYDLSNDGTYYIIYGIGNITSKNVVIPSHIDGLPVAEISNYAFSGCENILTIKIPETVIKIGDYAFEDCSKLSQLVLPDSVEEYGSYILKGCLSLTKLELSYVSDNIYELFGSEINYDTYNNPIIEKDGYEVITYTSSSYQKYEGTKYNTYYEGTYYYYPDLLKEIHISRGIIKNKFIYNNDIVNDIYLGKNITSIGNDAFRGCSSLTNVYYLGTIEDWCNITFSSSPSNPMYYASHFYMLDENNEWYEVTRIEIPNGVTSIGNYAFYNCSSLTSIVIPNSVTSIGDSTFYNCSSLTNVYYLGTIGDWCNITLSSATSNPMNYASHFYMLDENNEWYEVTKIVIPNSVTSIGNYAFYNCSSLTSIVIPNSVTSIGNYAFYNCSSLTSIVIPNSVTSIGDYAFYNCDSLTIYCETSSKPSGWNSNWNYSNRPVYREITNEDIVEQNGIQYLIINGEATITRYVGNDSEVVIPSSIEINGTTYNVTSIGNDAFSDCSSLTTVTFEERSQLKSIGKDAFYKCSSLTSIVIPNSVTSIGFYAFSKCSSLESITLPFVGQYADGSGATHFGYIFGALSYSNNSSYVPSSLKEVIITGGTSIGEYAFSGCSSLTSITIPNSVTSIGNSAFSSCDSLTSITIPNSVTSIGNYAFSNCSSLTSITIPNSVKIIGGHAFSSCDSLTIYCEASSKPSGWNSYWNYSNRPVVWGYKGN